MTYVFRQVYIYVRLSLFLEVKNMVNNLSKIKATVKRINDPIIRERLLMVQQSYSQSLRDVAKTFGVTHGKVDFWKKRYESQGLLGLHTKNKMGRPKKISAEQTVKIRRIVRKHNIRKGWQTQAVRKIIYEEAGVKYSVRQTIRIVQSWGMSKIIPRKKSVYSNKENNEAFLKKTRASWHVNQ